MKFFLQLRNWQLFLLLVVIPFVLNIAGTVMVFATKDPLLMLNLFPVYMIYIVLVFFGWLYSVGSHLHRRLPATVSVSIRPFRILMLTAAAYITLIAFFAYKIPQSRQPFVMKPVLIPVLLLSHVFAMFCIFYCLYFVARALKTVELQRKVTLGDYIGEFFLLWFFPAGVWIIQPRINKLFQKKEGTDTWMNGLQ